MDHNSIEAIERRDVRRARRMSEIERVEAIDRLADQMLDDAGNDGIPATEVWDMAAARIDARQRRIERDERERAWAADRQMVADMERDGLL